jgi:hypothetical protein
MRDHRIGGTGPTCRGALDLYPSRLNGLDYVSGLGQREINAICPFADLHI